GEAVTHPQATLTCETSRGTAYGLVILKRCFSFSPPWQSPKSLVLSVKSLFAQAEPGPASSFGSGGGTTSLPAGTGKGGAGRIGRSGTRPGFARSPFTSSLNSSTVSCNFWSCFSSDAGLGCESTSFPGPAAWVR